MSTARSVSRRPEQPGKKGKKDVMAQLGDHRQGRWLAMAKKEMEGHCRALSRGQASLDLHLKKIFPD